ncbi:ATP-binding protein [Bacteroides acidifaciens]|uniref:ATP-binding protein n=1 Tax=Bacteroides acidifaciens TaxID=85831 RepID=UPI0025978243|nr:ATP-binding protein [Bacteroides acidifaciens]
MKTTILNQRAERDELLSRPYQQRHTKYDADELLQNPLIKLITGPRRVGKSVFALLMLQGQNFAYLNFDDNQLLEKWDEDLAMSALDDVYPDYDFMLLDEIQNLPDWDLWVSKLYRRGKNLIITGSNANMLSSEMATVLTGRYLQIEMLPFSLDETMRWKNISPDREEQAPQAIVLADDYMRNGGYPETIPARGITKNYLSTLFDSILLKDVAQRHNVRNTTDLYNLATYLLSNFCNPISANELAGELGLSSVATTKKFCDYLNEPYLFFYLPRFNNKLKLMNKAPKKVYVVDNGFVQSTAFNLSENLGKLLENQVFVELLRRGYIPGQTLFYYRTRNDKEIDFVTRKGTKVEQLIQVCYDMTSEKTRKRELDALVEATEELHCDNLLVITNNQEEITNYKDRKIEIIDIRAY